MQKAVFILAGLQLAAGLPHSSHGTDAPTTQPSIPEPAPTGSAPQGCNLLNTDSEWPAADVWTSALGDVEPGEDGEGSNRPDYILAAPDVETVQAAVKFVAEHNIRLSVVNSGHDFLGRNDAPSGLSLDISHLTGIKPLDSFTPSESGAESPSGNESMIQPLPGQQAAVTFGAGESTGAINEALDASGLFTIGAAHDSVKTAGGYGQTAGHSPFSSKYGLGADQVLEYKVVTADGELVVANSVVNTDLFWALRGGGGGTFGIVVEATVKAHPSPKITVANWWINATDTENPGEGIWDAMAYLHSQFPAINKQGVQGYYYLYPNAMKGIFAMTEDEGTQDIAKGIWEPILEELAGYEGMEPAVSEYTDFPSFVEYFNAKIEGEGCGDDGGHDHGGGEDDGHGHEHKRGLVKRHGGAEPMGITPLDSRLLGQSHLESPELAQALKDAMPQVPKGQLRGHLIGGGKVLNPDDDTSVLPAWRQAYVHLIGTGEALVGDGEGEFNVNSLRALAPDMGAYVNEASSTSPNWKQDFWGENYDRLSELKTKYDPNGVFWVTPGINADQFEVVDGRVCKTAEPSDSTTAPASDNLNMATSSEDANTSPFPGTETCPTDPPSNSTQPPDFYVEPDLDASKPPTTDGATLTRIKYGPYNVDAMGMISNRPDLRLELPCDDCYITALQADLVYEDDTTANVDTGAWLHHMVLSKSGLGAEDLRCPMLPLTERIYASGNERSVSRTNGVAPYGIEIGFGDSVNMIYDLMNESDQPITVYIAMTYEWVPADTEGYKPVEMAWLDVTGCGLSSFPAEEGQFMKTSPGWKSTVNGRLLSASGHLHNGGLNTTIFKNGEPVCASRQAYGTKPEFVAPDGRESISASEMCVDFGEVAVGDELVISAYYDGDQHPLDHAHDGSGLEPVMGISRVYIGT